jgi:hypothetical protein
MRHKSSSWLRCSYEPDTSTVAFGEYNMRRGILVLLLAVMTTSVWAQPAAKSPSAKQPVAKQPAVKQPAAKQAAPGRSACVLSVIGHAFQVQKIGVMVFGNSRDDIAIDSWGIDDLVARKVSAILGKQFKVRQLAVSRDVRVSYATPGLLFRSQDKMLDILRGATAGLVPCDIYVAVTQGGSGFGSTNQRLVGLGIMQHGGDLGIIKHHFLHALYEIRIYDGNTMAVLSDKTPGTDAFPLSALVGPGIRGMSREVDEAWWPAAPQAAASSAQLKSATWTLIEQGLETTLPGMLQPGS